MNDLKAIHKTVIILGFLAAIVILQLFGQSTAAFITVGIMTLSAIGFNMGMTQQVKENTNGTMQRWVSVVQTQLEGLQQQIERQSERHHKQLEEFSKLLANAQPPKDQEVSNNEQKSMDTPRP